MVETKVILVYHKRVTVALYKKIKALAISALKWCVPRTGVEPVQLLLATGF